uniref:NADH-ubiquinone oxidoreductase chain 1 n=1 Tax=Dimorphostylis asiatica TaxID=2840398 RepID=A0A8F8AIV7_9CRUS|nr:NADH dehydrogenase subunit 1 [Dimorphostylis asiatica]
MILVFLKLFVLMVMVMISTAFFTLTEHKVLGYCQLRKGPNKVGYYGIMQPFSDAMKLLLKDMSCFMVSNEVIFFIGPQLSLVVSLMVWMVFTSSYGVSSVYYSMIFLFGCFSLSVYSILGSGWSSNSKYSILGSLRGAAQSISYEVVLVLLVVSFIFFSGCFSMEYFTGFSLSMNILFYLPVFSTWMVVSMAETNRTPFDFSESESELVSGFNTEYGSGSFVLIFLAEYMSILFISSFTSFFFFGFMSSFFLFLSVSGFLAFFFVWVRSTLPRLRYDMLMMLVWKIYLPLVISLIMIYISLKFFI